MDSKEFNKAIIFLLVVTIFFWFAGLNNFYGHSSDEQAHRNMANDVSVEPNYSPLLRSVSWLFAKSDSAWVLWVMFLFAFVTPLLLVKITGSWWAALFYFAVTSQFYWVIQGGFAQGLVLIFVLGLFAFKDNRLRIPIFVIGLASHSTAPLLLSFTLLMILLNENWGLIFSHLKGFKNVVFGLTGCSALLGKNIDKNSVLNQPINASTLSGNTVSYWGNFITPWSILTLFGKIFPVFFAVPSCVKLWKLKRFDLLALIVFGLLASLEYGTRSWYLLFIPLVIGFTWYWQGLTNKNHKRFWFVIVIFYLAFQLYMWVNFNMTC